MFSTPRFFAAAAAFIGQANAYVVGNQGDSDFLETKSKEEGVVTLPSGLRYKVLRKGTGRHHMIMVEV